MYHNNYTLTQYIAVYISNKIYKILAFLKVPHIECKYVCLITREVGEVFK